MQKDPEEVKKSEPTDWFPPDGESTVVAVPMAAAAALSRDATGDPERRQQGEPVATFPPDGESVVAAVPMPPGPAD